MKRTSPEKPRGLIRRAFSPDEQQRLQLIDWFVLGVSYETIKKRLVEVFKIHLKSIGPLERFWSVEGVPVMKWQKLRPDHASPLGWEITRRDAVKKLEDPLLPHDQRKAVLKFLETGRYQKPNTANPEPGAPGSATSHDNPETSATENPFDDQDKLDEVRREVFGSAPNSKKPAPTT